MQLINYYPKNRILLTYIKANYLSVPAFYHELDRKIAILKNNKSYVINNIRTQGLIKQLRSADCLSDIKARLIGRKPVKTVQPKLSKLGPDFGKSDTAELLHAVQLFDDARLSTFINCLRHSNQKLLARIAETGGGKSLHDYLFYKKIPPYCSILSR